MRILTNKNLGLSGLILTAAGALLCQTVGCTFIAEFEPYNENNNTNNNTNTNTNLNINTNDFTFSWPARAGGDIDLLFMVDNSNGMLEEQGHLQEQFAALSGALASMPGGLPSVHIGVVTPDLGTAPYTTIRYCEEFGGDAGVLGKVDNRNYTEECVGAGQRYLVNVEPVGCDIDKDENGDCTAHNCVQSHCDDIANANEALTMTMDASSQCPRCVNFSGTLQETFSCMASVDSSGCGFEQQLEAVYLALQSDNVPNAGFLRDDAFLAIVLVTDEDDCSSNDATTLFDPSQNAEDATMGFLTSFRCFEFGIACDEGGRTVGPRNNCAPSEDATSLLHPISRYTALLEALRPPERLLVASIAGPFDGDAAVQLDTANRQEVVSSCSNVVYEGKPGIRLKAFSAYFNDPADMDPWAFANICTADFGQVLTNIGNTIVAWMSRRCVEERIRGCPQGVDGTACSPCLPWCDIFDVEARGTAQQRKRRIPWCGRVCQSDVCTAGNLSPCEYDQNNRCLCTPPEYPTRVGMEEGCAALHYPGGIPPDDRDPDLASVLSRREPTCTGTDCVEGTEGQASACWYLERDITCPVSVKLRIARAQIPPPGTFVEGGCADPLLAEDVCDDGLDNDEDCLVDDQDPDCQQ